MVKSSNPHQHAFEPHGLHLVSLPLYIQLVVSAPCPRIIMLLSMDLGLNGKSHDPSPRSKMPFPSYPSSAHPFWFGYPPNPRKQFQPYSMLSHVGWDAVLCMDLNEGRYVNEMTNRSCINWENVLEQRMVMAPDSCWVPLSVLVYYYQHMSRSIGHRHSSCNCPICAIPVRF